MNRQYLIMGKNCLQEVMKRAPQRIVELFVSKKSDISQKVASSGVKVSVVPKVMLDKLVHSESHQGYVAALTKRENIDVRAFLESSQDKKKSTVLMLDSIFDPQNLGAIIRAGECFAVDLIIYSKNRGSDITPVTTKTSAGATELVPIAKVSNLADTMALFQKAGYFSIAAEVKEGAESLYDFDPPGKILLILGSEGKGIQPLLSKKSDFHLYVPMLGSIDSLNVSQAAAVFLSHLCNL